MLLTMQQKVPRKIQQSSRYLNTVKLKSDIVSLIGEDRISRSILKDGSAGISCWKSYVSPVTGEMNITVNYKVMIRAISEWAVLLRNLKSRSSSVPGGDMRIVEWAERIPVSSI